MGSFNNRHSNEFIKGLVASSTLDVKMKTLEQLLEVHVADVEDPQQLAYSLVELSRDTVRFGPPSNTSPLLASLAKVLLKFIQYEQYLDIFRGDNSLLEKLSLWPMSEDNVFEQDLENWLRIAQLLTTDIILSYKNPSLAVLVASCSKLVTTKLCNSAAFLLSLRILNNLCQRSPVAILEIRSCSYFKDLWASLMKGVSIVPRNQVEIRISIMSCNLLVLLDYNQSGIRFGLLHAEQALQMIVPEETDQEIQNEGQIDAIRELNFLLSTLRDEAISHANATQMSQGMTDYQAIMESQPAEEHGNALKYKFITVANIVLRYLETIASNVWHPDQIVALLDMVVGLTPDFVVLSDDGSDLLHIASEIMITLSRPTHDITAASWLIIESYLHLIKQIMKVGGDTLLSFEETFPDMYQHFFFLNGTQQGWERQAIACSRVLALLKRVPSLREINDERFQSELPKMETILKQFLKSNLNPFLNDIENKCLLAIVEIFGFIADNSQNKNAMTLLMEFKNKPTISRYIAMAIVSGNRELICRAFSITNSVCFTGEYANELVLALADQNYNQTTLFPKIITHKTSLITSVQGLGRLEERLESFNASVQSTEPDGTNLSEIVSFYELKSSYYETEIGMLRGQMFELHRNSEQVSLLMKKERQLMARRLSAMQLKEVQITALNEELSKSVALNAETKQSYETKISDYKRVLEQKKKKLEETFKLIANSEKIQMELQKTIKDCEAELKLVKDELGKMKTKLEDTLTAKNKDQEDSKGKILRLQRENRKAEEERKRLESLLEKEKKTVDTIRGLLGNNIGAL